MHIRDLMCSEPITVPSDAQIGQALILMASHGMRHITVVDNEDQFIGIARWFDAKTVASQPEGACRGVLTITRIGTPAVKIDEPLESVWSLLVVASEFDPLPVISEGRLCGTISKEDMKRAGKKEYKLPTKYFEDYSPFISPKKTEPKNMHRTSRDSA